MKIEGIFSNYKHANNTVDELKKNGFKNTFVDLNEHIIDDRNVRTNLPGTATGPSLSGLVLESGEYAVDRSKAPLTAASPMVSGMGSFDEIAYYNCKVVVEVDHDKEETVENIIKKMGGEINDPNVQKPKGLDEINYL